MDANKRAEELGKQAAIVAKTVRICVSKPGAKKKTDKALHADKAYNAGGPWRQGRKPQKRKRDED